MTPAEKENLKINFERVLAYRLFYCNDLAEREQILVYLASGKGTIPYQIITKLDSLSKTPDSDFFDRESFYSTLREKNISDEEYENVKKNFQILNLRTLGDLNKIYRRNSDFMRKF